MKTLELSPKSLLFLETKLQEIKETTVIQNVEQMPYDIEKYACSSTSCKGGCGGTCSGHLLF
jgi:hypothetical protein